VDAEESPRRGSNCWSRLDLVPRALEGIEALERILERCGVERTLALEAAERRETLGLGAPPDRHFRVIGKLLLERRGARFGDQERYDG